MKSSVIPRMVDISSKDVIRREATAEGHIVLKKSTLELMQKGKVEKGDALQIASVAAIQAVKSTPTSLMMCHPIPVESATVKFTMARDSIGVRVTVVAESRTGVEMEALNGVSSALLNIWDVVKKYEKDEKGQYPGTRIRDIHVVEKIKGKG
jgi:cyclic pyranopterin monophosphate synthase